jgi:hypothetical protein
MNWRGRPLTSHEVVVETITATTTRTGLTVYAELDPGTYRTGVTVTGEQMSALALTPHHWHGEWNYTLHPKTIEPPAPAPSRRAARIAESGHAPDWLAHPTLTGMNAHDWDQLLTAFQEYLTTQPPLSLTPRSHLDPDFGARTLSPRDRLLATVITLRWSTHRAALASILGISSAPLARAVRETTLDLSRIGRTIPRAPIKATTTDALLALIGQSPTEQLHQ